MTTYATIIDRNAFVWTDFGLQLATRYFGEPAIAALPKFKRGKHAGKPKALITWQKVERGGWWARDDEQGHVERRVGQIIAMELREAEFGKLPEKQAVIHKWRCND